MNDRQFVTILNRVAATMPGGPLEPVMARNEAQAIQMWAEFLRRCVENGVSVGDPRWKSLEVQRVGARPRFRLPSGAEPVSETKDDFSVGLTLLMGMLHPDDPA